MTKNIKFKSKKLSLNKRLEIEEKIDNALCFLEKGDFDYCKKVLNKLGRKYKDNVDINFAKGAYCTKQDDYDNALLFFKKTVFLDPKYSEAYFNIAIIYKNNIDIKNMIINLRKVIEIGSDDEYVLDTAKELLFGFEENIMKESNISLDDYLEANELFDKAFKIMQNRQWEEAIPLFEKAVEINSFSPQTYGNLGLCYGCLGKNKQALLYLDKSLEQDPNYEVAAVNRTIINALGENEKLSDKELKAVDYYKDYGSGDKSYIEEHRTFHR